MSAQPTEALLRRQQVQDICAFGRSTLWAKVRDRTFPAPLRTGPRTRAWTRSSVMAWIAAKVEASRSPDAGPK